VTEFKLIAAFLVLLAGFAGGGFANRFLKGKSSHNSTALANTFAGGVFLGAALLHMLPDAIGNFNIYFEEFNYPLFALATSFGFLVVLLLDKVIGPALERDKNENAIYPYILMATLSVHSIITGMALGLEDQLISAGAILFAILAHKSTAAIALSVSFTREDVPARRSRNLQRMFYTTTPIGILLGTWWSVSIEGPGEAKFEGIFDALAAGTFLYIAVMDILSEEFAGSTRRLPRYAMTLIGFTIMAIVAIWA
jgi:solute carrier family 39 (zinc transporter), member 1/2/3